MDFTREPIIETVITPKEGWKLVIRNSKANANEEYFVDAIEIVSFGQSQFFRTQERPKSFLLPVSDFEILEVREARMVLKNVSVDRNIKIGGGRDALKTSKESETKDKVEKSEKGEGRKRQRRVTRRRRSKDGVSEETEQSPEEDRVNESSEVEVPISPPRPMIAPPPNLISETIARYREDETYAGAFYDASQELPEEEQPEGDVAPYFQSDEEFDESDQLLFGKEESKPKAAPKKEKIEEPSAELLEEELAEEPLEISEEETITNGAAGSEDKDS